MSCSIEDHKKKTNDAMHEIFHDTETIKFVDGIVTITPSSKSKLIKDIKAANKAADERINKANEWGKKEYGQTFSGFAIKNKSKSDANKVVINVQFPDALEQSYIYKKKAEVSLIDYNNKILNNSPDDIFNVKFNKKDENYGYKDPELASKFFENSNETTALEILEKIKDSKNPLNLLAKRLLNHSKFNNVKIILDDKPSYNMYELGFGGKPTDEANAYYDIKNNQIRIAKDAYFRKGSSEITILHEILHSVTYHKLRDGSQSSRDFQKLYHYTITQLNRDDFYGLTDKDEFIVALFTDSVLIQQLKGIPASRNTKHYDNLFQELFDYILSLIGIGRTNSLYEQAFSVATHILTEQAESGQSLKDSVESDAENNALFSKQEKSKAPTFERQYVHFKRSLNRLKRELSRVSDQEEYDIKKAELDREIARFNKATEEQDKDAYVVMANEHLDWVETLINNLPTVVDKYVLENLTNAFEILNAFPANEFHELNARSEQLRTKLFPYIVKNNMKVINKHNTSGKTITEVMVDEQNKDIGLLNKSFGALSNLGNYIANTIGSLITEAQNSASSLNKQVEAIIQTEVDALKEYAKSNGITLEQVYDLFIQETDNGSTELTKRYTKDQTENPNFTKIQNTPELNKFYKFYQRVTIASQMNLPYKVGKHHILNVKKSNLKSDLLNAINPTETIQAGDFVSNEELVADMIQDMYRTSIDASEKSRDLGASLLEFAAYSNKHAAMSKVLPEVRLLQEHLKYEQKADGSLAERQFVDSANPKNKINAEKSNIFNMVDVVIDMQVKGQMKVNKSTPFKWAIVKDIDGNVISYKQVRLEDVVDKMLRWNSLLRIGLSPITSITNVVFGDVSNFIEAVGGKHFTVKQMNKATNIFRKQLDYVGDKSEGTMYKWLKLLNPLQEIADAELGDGLKANKSKLSVEKSMEIMYSMQRKGEFYLQARTMIALLIADGYMNEDGSNTPKGNNISEEDAIRMSDKIQALNQQIHGRYTTREASILSQHAWFRAMIQFRKWIPSAVEQRFGSYKEWDKRLQTDSEGRYLTLKNKVFKADSVSQAFENLFLPILNSKEALERGNMTPTEIYNMRKNMIELILITATALLYLGLKGDDEDDEWKKNAYYKTSMTVLNRISGDLLFFYNPSNVSNIMKNVAPMSKLIVDLIDVTKSLPHAMYLGDYKIKKGSLKGSNEFYVDDVPSIVPGFAPLKNIRKMLNSTDILPELN